jgi:hypothetical protein
MGAGLAQRSRFRIGQTAFYHEARAFETLQGSHRVVSP